MAEHTYRTCDRCGEKLPGGCRPLHIPFDTYRDTASGRTEEEYREIDLCHNCLRAELLFVIKDWPLEQKVQLCERMCKTVR
ncbi:hypothetical protein [Desulfallas thermosapovorans]|uniref:Uncharacterized protein n=1 Tax=Desulfallas thermosapovorans DSM 6562 TaxID=1121431 RepID=A0A5S4ZQB4_9FIRM|nr:hypothetical protein [Desulfallas thermosapovorans]TYO94874.1 hypothetical protein LX24_02128 [Desulfallas thermosapovorans DSM 6562]